MFNSFPKNDFILVGQDGLVKGHFKGIYSSKVIIIDDAKAPIEVGDELRRKIPNGSEEAFSVIDPVYSDGLADIPPHFQVKITRKGTFAPGAGGNMTVHFNAPNARMNVSSTDNSQNNYSGSGVFSNLRDAISKGVDDEIARDNLLSDLYLLEAAASNKTAFLPAYQKFIAGAANHMTIIAPFLPVLASMVAG